MPEEIAPPLPPAVSPPSPEAAAAGLTKRMSQVTRLLATSGVDLSEKVTHDLRVAIRRCRSVAYNAAPLDPDGTWQSMSKELRRVFRALGHLRDLHVLQQWIDRLGTEIDPIRNTVTVILQKREPHQIDGIREALHRFNRERWEEWRKTLPNRLEDILISHPLLVDLARERLRAFLSSSQGIPTTDAAEAWHQARVSLKRFRYTVENFLPDRYQAWEKDFASLQDIMGEIHDLDVLNDYLLSLSPLFELSDRQHWRKRIQKERHTRVRLYNHIMTGQASPRKEWEEGL